MTSSSPVKIAPSILSADFARLAEEVAAVEAGGADWLHVDVMDGHFVPNLTVGPPIVESLRKVTTLPLDVHLMMTNPDAFIPDFAQAGADYLTVHTEACPHLHRTIHAIKEHGVKAGVTLNPSTSLNAIEEVVTDVDLVLIMSVNPGFGGQTFIPSSLDKIRRAKHLLDRTGSQAFLEVDGGVNLENTAAILHAAQDDGGAGTTVLVAGSAIFARPDYAATIAAFRAIPPSPWPSPSRGEGRRSDSSPANPTVIPAKAGIQEAGQGQGLGSRGRGNKGESGASR